MGPIARLLHKQVGASYSKRDIRQAFIHSLFKKQTERSSGKLPLQNRKVGSSVSANNFSNHRQLIQLKGSLSWCFQQCEQLLSEITLPYFWLGSSPAKITPALYKQLLGQECSLLIINAHQQFDANQFAASEGTLRGGGTLILLSPTSIDTIDYFYQYIDQRLQHSPFICIAEHRGEQLDATRLGEPSKPQLALQQQQRAVDAIIKTVSGHRRRPLVLTANRGRGKSAALGIAAKQLVASGLTNILVCAPSKAMAATLFKHAGDSPSILFIAPDQLLIDKPQCELLLIDEAAALPVPMLETLAKHYSRLVFATTLHGYEGSGRGFALRFQNQLQQIAPQMRKLHIDQPIRWDENDPLEQFTLDNLCLTESLTATPQYQPQHPLQMQQVTTQQLLEDHKLLSELFSLLVSAHYQTKPSDLESLFTDPALTVLTLTQHEQILAVALINAEGALDEQLAQQVYLGERRLKGNLIAQSLTFHCAQPQAALHRYARVQRIATHPALQQQGLGTLFINEIKSWAQNANFDHLSASFGATEPLLRFWQNKQFQTLRIGASKDKSSGTHSFIVNLPLTNRAQKLHKLLLQQFQLQLATQLTRQLQSLEAQLIVALLSEIKNTIDAHPLVNSYSSGNLPYEFAEQQLIQLMLNSDLSLLAKSQQSLTIQKILQNRSWAELCQSGEYTGKKQAQQALRSSIQQLTTSTQSIEE